MIHKLKLMLLALLTIAVSACSGTTTSSPSGGDVANTTGQEQGSDKPFAPFSDLETIELLTPTSGVGQKPNFEWSAVDGAASYTLFLNFSDGQPYWTWSGQATSIYLGGYDSPPPADAAGPILLDGMSWAVIAFNTEANVVASSDLRLISP